MMVSPRIIPVAPTTEFASILFIERTRELNAGDARSVHTSAVRRLVASTALKPSQLSKENILHGLFVAHLLGMPHL